MPKLEIVTNLEAKRSKKKRHIWPMSNSGGIYLHKEQVADRMKGCSHGDHELSTGGTWVRPNTKQNQQRREVESALDIPL